MAIETRRASIADMTDLIRIRMMAHGGFNEALYEDLGSRPLIPHPRMIYSGEGLLMACSVQLF